MKVKLLSVILLLAFTSCVDSDPNVNTKGEDIMDSLLVADNATHQEYQDTVYVPIYSDIYSESRQKSILLTATLSIRSTSLVDTTYINFIDYYDTQGNKIRSYVDDALMLKPMASLDYVIDREDATGGTGANFLVGWSAKKDTRPLIEAVMISTSGQHGLSFITKGMSLKQ